MAKYIRIIPPPVRSGDGNLSVFSKAGGFMGTIRPSDGLHTLNPPVKGATLVKMGFPTQATDGTTLERGSWAWKVDDGR